MIVKHKYDGMLGKTGLWEILVGGVSQRNRKECLDERSDGMRSCDQIASLKLLTV